MTTQNIHKHFAATYQLEEQVNEAATYWDETMQMIADEWLPPPMCLYCAWNTFCARKIGNWTFFAPNHIFRLPTDKYFLIAQNKKKWLRYMTETEELHLTCPGKPTIIYKSILDINNQLK